MTSERLPKTDSLKELARFWDTHELTEVEDQLVEVREPVFERKPETTLPKPPLSRPPTRSGEG